MKVVIEFVGGSEQGTAEFQLDVPPINPEQVAAKLFYIATMEGSIGCESTLNWPFRASARKARYRVSESTIDNGVVRVKAVVVDQ